MLNDSEINLNERSPKGYPFSLRLKGFKNYIFRLEETQRSLTLDLSLFCRTRPIKNLHRVSVTDRPWSRRVLDIYPAGRTGELGAGSG